MSAVVLGSEQPGKRELAPRPIRHAWKIITAPAFEIVALAGRRHAPRLAVDFADPWPRQQDGMGMSYEYPLPLIPSQRLQFSRQPRMGPEFPDAGPSMAVMGVPESKLRPPSAVMRRRDGVQIARRQSAVNRRGRAARPRLGGRIPRRRPQRPAVAARRTSPGKCARASLAPDGPWDRCASPPGA